jgi:hypothetical protein
VDRQIKNKVTKLENANIKKGETGRKARGDFQISRGRRRQIATIRSATTSKRLKKQIKTKGIMTFEHQRIQIATMRETRIQHIKITVQIHLKGRLGLLLRPHYCAVTDSNNKSSNNSNSNDKPTTKTHQGYRVESIQSVSPLSGKLQVGDVVSHWNSSPLSNVDAEGLHKIIAASQDLGNFVLNVKRMAEVPHKKDPVLVVAQHKNPKTNTPAPAPAPASTKKKKKRKKTKIIPSKPVPDIIEKRSVGPAKAPIVADVVPPPVSAVTNVQNNTSRMGNRNSISGNANCAVLTSIATEIKKTGMGSAKPVAPARPTAMSTIVSDIAKPQNIALCLGVNGPQPAMSTIVSDLAKHQNIAPCLGVNGPQRVIQEGPYSALMAEKKRLVPNSVSVATRDSQLKMIVGDGAVQPSASASNEKVPRSPEKVQQLSSLDFKNSFRRDDLELIEAQTSVSGSIGVVLQKEVKSCKEYVVKNVLATSPFYKQINCGDHLVYFDWVLLNDLSPDDFRNLVKKTRKDMLQVVVRRANPPMRPAGEELKYLVEALPRIKTDGEARMRQATEDKTKRHTEAQSLLAEEEAKRRAEAEARVKAAEEARLRQAAKEEEEAKIRAEAEARVKAAAEEGAKGCAGAQSMFGVAQRETKTPTWSIGASSKTINLPNMKQNESLGLVLKYNHQVKGLLVLDVSETSTLVGTIIAGDLFTHLNSKSLENCIGQEFMYRIKKSKKNLLIVRHVLHHEVLIKDSSEQRSGLIQVNLSSYTSPKRKTCGSSVLNFGCKPTSEGLIVTEIDSYNTGLTGIRQGDLVIEYGGQSTKLSRSIDIKEMSVTTVADTDEIVYRQTKDNMNVQERETTEGSVSARIISKIRTNVPTSPKAVEATPQTFAKVFKPSQLPHIRVNALPVCHAFVVGDPVSERLADKKNKSIQDSVMLRHVRGKRKLRAAYKSAKKLKKPNTTRAAQDLPDGWTEEVHKRGDSGSIYKYYFSPAMKFKFRTKRSVLMFIDSLEITNGDENSAYDLIKEKLR